MAGAVAVGGALMTIAGNIQANQAQAAAERRNAAFYEQQGEFARKAMKRELDIYNIDSAEAIGNQESGFARGGVTMDGSPMTAVAASIFKQVKERTAIKDQGEAQIQEAYLRAGASRFNAGYLSSFSYNALQTGTTVLGAYASYAAASAASSGGGTTNNYYGSDGGYGGGGSYSSPTYSFGQYSRSPAPSYGFGGSWGK